ncbi:hypothetical protein [Sediminihabitans luteus]|nr:hypothetical protein [Sediminihabitans luteus]
MTTWLAGWWPVLASAAVMVVVLVHAVLSRARVEPVLGPDPLVALRVQVRLSELAAELRRIEADPDLYGRVHHYRAVRGAYDGLLREACALAGLSLDAPALQAGMLDDPDERMREELELSARGWSW